MSQNVAKLIKNCNRANVDLLTRKPWRLSKRDLIQFRQNFNLNKSSKHTQQVWALKNRIQKKLLERVLKFIFLLALLIAIGENSFPVAEKLLETFEARRFLFVTVVDVHLAKFTHVRLTHVHNPAVIKTPFYITSIPIKSMLLRWWWVYLPGHLPPPWRTPAESADSSPGPERRFWPSIVFTPYELELKYHVILVAVKAKIYAHDLTLSEYLWRT